MKIFSIRTILFSLAVLVFSCNEEDYEQATITFYPTLSAEATEPAPGEQGIATTIRLLTSRVLPQESQINIRVIGNGAGYGNSYVTNPPQLTPGIVTLTIPAGGYEASFEFIPKNDGIVEVNGYNYTFKIEEYSNEINSAGQGSFSLYVAERPLFFTDFNDCSTAPSGFTERIVTGAMAASTWGCTSFGYPNESTNAVEANAFGKGSGTSNSYLVLNEPIDVDANSTLNIKMLVYSRFSGAGEIKVKYSNTYSGSGNPEAAGVTWTEVTDLSAQLPNAGSRVWTPVSGVIENVQGSELYIAIQFVGGTTSSSSNWRIENFEIK